MSGRRENDSSPPSGRGRHAPLSDEQIRHMLRPGDSDRERSRRTGLRALLGVLARHPGWTLLGLAVTIVASLWTVLPRDKDSERLDALTRREHELLDQRAHATSPAEVALIDADLEQVRKKASELVDRLSPRHVPASPPELARAPTPATSEVGRTDTPVEAESEPLREDEDGTPASLRAPVVRPPAAKTGVGALDEGPQDAPPDRPSDGGASSHGRVAIKPAPGVSTDGAGVSPPDVLRRPAVPQTATWLHAGVLRFELETLPRRGETAREIVRRHRTLVDELQRWLPGD